MVDLTYADGCIVDLKVMKDFEPMFRQEEGRLSFVEYWRYDLQMAIYQELMRQEMGSKVPCYILAASKQDPPDLTLVQVPQELLDFNLKWLTDRLPDINLIKTGEVLGIRLTTIHNIHFLTNLMKEMRQAILEDRMPEFRQQFYKNLETK